MSWRKGQIKYIDTTARLKVRGIESIVRRARPVKLAPGVVATTDAIVPRPRVNRTAERVENEIHRIAVQAKGSSAGKYWGPLRHRGATGAELSRPTQWVCLGRCKEWKRR